MSLSNIRNLQTSMGVKKNQVPFLPKWWKISTPFCKSGFGFPGPVHENPAVLRLISQAPLSMTQVYLGPSATLGNPKCCFRKVSVCVNSPFFAAPKGAGRFDSLDPNTAGGEFRFQEFLLPCYQLTRVTFKKRHVCPHSRP